MVEKQQTFRDLIADNKRKSVILVTVFCLFTALLAVVLTLGFMAYVAPSMFSDEGSLAIGQSHGQPGRHAPVVQPEAGPRINWPAAIMIGITAGATALAISFLGLFSGDDLIMVAHGARKIQHDSDPELFNVVEEMAIAGGVPLPQVYLIHDPAPNAFATGRDPHHAAIAITTGLRGKLTRDELQGVIAHEMSHVRNYDIRLMLLLAVLVGSVVMLCDIFWQLVRWGWTGPSGKDVEAKGDATKYAAIFLVLAIVLSIVAPILAQIIQLAVSRQREFLADATGVQLTRNPLGLANALRIIRDDPAILKTGNRATAHLYIVNPIQKFQERAHTVFASHPPIDERIRRLEDLAHVYRKE
jgi:heat shock protein HtpX